MTEKKTEIESQSFEQRFLLLISELKAPKNQRNSFGKYNYRSAEDILEAVKPLAAKYFLIPNLSDKIIIIGDRYYLEATATIMDALSEKKVESTGLAREPLQKKGMDDSQITGTASSYARKYAMNGLYQIDDTKDADSDEYKKEADAKAPKQITKTQAEAMNKKIENIAGLKGTSEGNVILPNELANTLTQKKFMQTIPIDKLDTEQFLTLNRYLDELEKFYQKK